MENNEHTKDLGFFEGIYEEYKSARKHTLIYRAICFALPLPLYVAYTNFYESYETAINIALAFYGVILCFAFLRACHSHDTYGDTLMEHYSNIQLNLKALEDELEMSIDIPNELDDDDGGMKDDIRWLMGKDVVGVWKGDIVFEIEHEDKPTDVYDALELMCKKDNELIFNGVVYFGNLLDSTKSPKTYTIFITNYAIDGLQLIDEQTLPSGRTIYAWSQKKCDVPLVLDDELADLATDIDGKMRAVVYNIGYGNVLSIFHSFKESLYDLGKTMTDANREHVRQAIIERRDFGLLLANYVQKHKNFAQ